MPNGIFWKKAQVFWINWGGTPFQGAELHLHVDGLPVPNATVVAEGNGVAGGSQPVTYSGPTTVDGTIYARYINFSGITYQPGMTYSLRTVTTVGTAAATLTAPGGVTLALDYSSVYWPYLGNGCNYAGVFVGICMPPCTCGWRFETNCNAVPPVNLTSGYDSCLMSYDLYATVRSDAYPVAGASGPSTFQAIQWWKGHNP